MEPPDCEDEERNRCPLHGGLQTRLDGYQDCPGCNGQPEEMDRPLGKREPTRREREAAHIMLQSVELWTGRHLSDLADLTPQQVLVALELVSEKFPGSDGDAPGAWLIVLLARALKQAQEIALGTRAVLGDTDRTNPREGD
jgi:hypothetical protein